MKSKKVKLLYPFTNSKYQSFLQDMADSLVDYGIEKIEPLPIKWNVRHIAAKLHICRNFPIISKKNALIVLGGGYIDASSFPFCFNHEIIPVLWDTWPRYWDEIVKSFKRHNVRLAFFTQKQTADFVKSKLPTVECVHLPEGIKAKKYIRPVKQLKDRPVDVLEMGRIYQSFHSQAIRSNTIVKYAQNNELLFPTFDDLLEGLGDAKIVTCFPRCMTHPEHAGDVETLTQRYWECMLSKCIIIGHAPHELVDLLGYNPVVEVDTKAVPVQLESIIAHINDYQDMVDKNYDAALKYADWSKRLPSILNALASFNYVVCISCRCDSNG